MGQLEEMKESFWMRRYFDRRRSNRSGRFVLLKTNTNRYVRLRFYPVLSQCLTKIIIVINLVCACVKTSAEDDDFQRLSRVGGGVVGMVFNSRGFMFWSII